MKSTQDKNTNLSSWLIAGISIGIAVAYFMDPDRGRRRRALVRDKAVHWNRVTSHLVEQKSHHLQNVMQGYWARLNLKKNWMGLKNSQAEVIH